MLCLMPQEEILQDATSALESIATPSFRCYADAKMPNTGRPTGALCHFDTAYLFMALGMINLCCVLQEGVLEDTPDLPSSAPDPTSPTTPKRNADAKDANPWEASWGDLMSSQESDTEFDTDSSMAGQQSDSAAAAGVIDNMQSSPAAAQGTQLVCGLLAL